MAFNFDECRELLRSAVLEALTENKERIAQLHKDEQISGMSFDILPWDPYVAICFRTREDWKADRESSADWKDPQFIPSWDTDALPSRQTDPLKRVCEYVGTAYQDANDAEHDDDEDPEVRTRPSCREVAHLIFLAAADAVLQPEVGERLESVGIDRPKVADEFPHTYFKYFVDDDDKTLRSNYCEIVLANRIASRLIKRVPGVRM